MKTNIPINIIPGFAAGVAGLLLCSAVVETAHAQDTITWNVAGDGVWDTTTANWTGDDTLYSDGDNVIFDNTAGGTITILGRSPASTTVNNASGEYIFVSEVPTSGGGAPSILTGTLVKDGAGTLQLGASNIPGPWTNPPYQNSFSSVTVNGGLIEYADHDAFGTGTVTMAGGTSLRGTGNAEGRYLANQEDLANDFNLTGSVGVPLSFSPGKDIWLDGNVSGAGGFDVTGSSRTLTLSGNNTFAGGVTLGGSGALQIGTYNGLGTGTLTMNQTTSTGTGGGLLAGQNLDGFAADRKGNVNAAGVINPIVIPTGRYCNLGGRTDSSNLLISGVISGDGTLRKFKSNNTVTLSGTNTYTGGTIIDQGTLRLNYNATSNPTGSGPGTGPVTINDGILFLFRITASNELVVNGGKLISENGFGNNWNGDVTLNVDLPVEPFFNINFGGTISGVGGLIVDQQSATVNLTGNNTYTGDTTVNSGILKVNGSSIADTNKLVISGGKVEPVGTETVDTLFFGGNQQAAGTWGATGSGATNIDDTHFSGTAGVVNVLTGLGLDQAEILSFGLPGWPAIITGTDIAWTVPVGTDVTNLAPTFEISFGANATPVSGTPRDFTTPQTYSIESGDTTVTNVYTVTVTEGAVPSVFDWAAAVDGNWSDAANWTDDLSIGAGPGTFGGSFYTLNFTQAGTYTATHDLSDPFQLNQLNFAGQVTLDQDLSNGLEFVADDLTLPTINQNSGSTVNVNLPLTLGADTTFGGSGSGQVNLSGLISGSGSLTKDGSGTLRVFNVGNSFTGGTIINSGRLWGDINAQLGTGPITLNNGELFMWRFKPANDVIINGGTVISENGFNENLFAGPITLNADLICNAFFQLTCSNTISGVGGVTKNNGGLMILSGTNTYTGDTTINAGTLRVTGSAIADTGKLVINGGKVEPVGTETVGSLFFGAVEQGPGTYGATGSGATNIDDSRFAGTAGVIQVGAANPFDSWASTGTMGPVTFGGDTNGDGVQDGIAFLLGAVTPDDDANGRLPTVSEDGSGNLVMQFDCLPSADRGTAQLRVAHSNTLGAWTATVDEVPDADDAVPDNNVTFVIVAGPVGPPATNTVTATIDGAAASGGKLFGRLEATE